MIVKKPTGLLPLLDEESRLEKGDREEKERGRGRRKRGEEREREGEERERGGEERE